MSATLANHLLDLVRGMGYEVTVTKIIVIGGEDRVHLQACGKDGHTWIAHDPDLYHAACLLAKLVGAELEE